MWSVGILSGGILSGGILVWGDSDWGDSDWGDFGWGDFVRGDFVQGGYRPGGFCPGGFCLRTIQRIRSLSKHYCYCPMLLMRTTKTAVCLQTKAIFHHLYGFSLVF